MEWTYSDYPVMKDGEPVLTSGTVEIEMTAQPRLLPAIKMGPTAEPTILHRAATLPATKWKFLGNVPEDLQRFVNGRYWCRIDTKMMAVYLRSRGMTDAADTYDLLAS